VSAALYAAASVTFIIGVAHSYLGERYILARLFRWPDLAKVFRNPEFTTRTLRFAWHVTSVAWWGLAAILALLARPPVSFHAISLIVGVTFLATSVAVLVGSRGRHLAWPLFLLIAIVALYAAGA
jgi:hypothetical protein